LLGPLESIVIGFPGADAIDDRIGGEIERVVANGTIRLVDIAYVARGPDGNTVILELDNKDDPRFAPFASVLGDRMALLTPEDLEHVASALPADSAGMVMLFEHRWAERRRGAPLLAAAATTAVVAGTAGAVHHYQQKRYARQDAGQQAAYEQAYHDGAAAAEQQVSPATPAPGIDLAELKQLAELHETGVLTDDEFATAKAKLIG
jgi:hypothetical protein